MNSASLPGRRQPTKKCTTQTPPIDLPQTQRHTALTIEIANRLCCTSQLIRGAKVQRCTPTSTGLTGQDVGHSRAREGGNHQNPRGQPPRSALHITPGQQAGHAPNFWRILKREPRSSPTRFTTLTPQHIVEAGAVVSAGRKKQRQLDRDAERNIEERFFCQRV